MRLYARDEGRAGRRRWRGGGPCAGPLTGENGAGGEAQGVRSEGKGGNRRGVVKGEAVKRGAGRGRERVFYAIIMHNWRRRPCSLLSDCVVGETHTAQNWKGLSRARGEKQDPMIRTANTSMTREQTMDLKSKNLQRGAGKEGAPRRDPTGGKKRI